MAMLRRRTTQLLAIAFSIVFAACLGGATWVIVRDPHLGLVVVATAIVGAVMLYDILDGPAFAAIVGAALGIVALGGYALYLAGASARLAVYAIGGVVVLVVVILLRAMIASGSADDPYDD
jgi:hypothetical protein